jgi:hypothetical protein
MSDYPVYFFVTVDPEPLFFGRFQVLSAYPDNVLRVVVAVSRKKTAERICAALTNALPQRHSLTWGAARNPYERP